MVPLGVLLTVSGLAGIVLSILRIRAARRDAAGDDAKLRAALQTIVPLNLGAFLSSMLGLMLVAVGLFLG